jgi:hypothetical protein
MGTFLYLIGFYQLQVVLPTQTDSRRLHHNLLIENQQLETVLDNKARLRWNRALARSAATNVFSWFGHTLET